ncbi:hypothetical protein [Nonomuraea jiangxiensis]|uniref:Uncharacterized protein n=1 Tax=Nonomuraea jiangxiensis TaxID=633440 RepID=A0A1G8UQH2_9ACTN|nr:hypothetical protein [Nonomuraea jiangxiensis]SDJ56031.1 hypothetical protein SAMN05421869_11162 [Nonomuraea jiangxiensis]
MGGKHAGGEIKPGKPNHDQQPGGGRHGGGKGNAGEEDDAKGESK